MEVNQVAVVQAIVFFAMDLLIVFKIWADRKKDETHKLFYIFSLTATTLQFLTIFNQLRIERIPNISNEICYAIYSIEYVLMAIIGYYWLQYFLLVRVDGKKRRRKYRWLEYTPMIAIAVVAVSSYLNDKLFQIQPEGSNYMYSLASMQWLTAFYYSYAILSLAVIIRQYFTEDRENVGELFKYFCIFIIPNMVATNVQLFLGVDYGYTQLGISFAVLLIYMEMYMKRQQEIERMELLEKSTEQLKEMYEVLNQQANTVAEAIHGGFKISRYDEGFSLKYVSSQFAHMLGYTREELLEASGGKMTGLVNIDDARRERKAAAESIKKNDMYTMNYRIRCADGSWKNVEDRGRLIRRPGEEDEFWCFISDRDEMIAKSRALDVANTRLSIIQSIFKTYYVAYYIDLREDAYTELSSMENLHRIYSNKGNATESLRDACSRFIQPEYADKMREFVDLSTLNERMKENDSITVQFKGVTAGWSQGFFISCERDEVGNVLTAILCARMIHEEKNREENQRRILIEAREAAERANEAKTVFLNNMSHDIRTPMNAILGFAQLLENQKDNPEVISDYVAKIIHAGEYLLDIINNVLDMARIESGKTVVEESLVRLGNVNSSAIPLFKEEFEKKNLTFVFEENIIHPYVLVDNIKTQQITVNILSNAIKYTPVGGEIRMNFTEQPSDKEGYAYYVMKISDNGIGMSKEFVDHIFESFSREHNTTESKIIGTGLGMPIVKKLVELMGGTIEVESEQNKGTTFTVTLLHKYVLDPEKYLDKPVSRAVDKETLRGKRILIAEDNELNAEIAVTILEANGFDTEVARDGVECIDMLNKADADYYDLILMDIQMPNLNGYVATERIRELEDEDKRNIPIIAMTANAFEEDKRMALEAGMNGHLAKPVVIDELMKELSKILE